MATHSSPWFRVFCLLCLSCDDIKVQKTYYFVESYVLRMSISIPPFRIKRLVKHLLVCVCQPQVRTPYSNVGPLESRINGLLLSTRTVLYIVYLVTPLILLTHSSFLAS